ncbi:hypothetical protein A3C59_00875 [Candidatus Daviesbacteria bacterium RIFCSPHIGHO2_02_FULL_36_13]|uniref:Uncharacterized protein n=1 Tax=Candidatus Daviesbacteria bacterium RIFCSPHIGHO2_02_FULL_36_13 TaxID=1797768 RepID=A0A1F5JRP2_9BACT|nr:MAG: hypothetical protein A3C59_00875 [Candidatus Daviesbacteria bacterium RIFCSPHIGHO2_02_FULL_36_13]OGE44178.1 MAG: hypothetical protein A3A45_01820 [Candidatus Daviesbacteria bacterium RIFCSPLOWO2_01_FULL_36_8]
MGRSPERDKENRHLPDVGATPKEISKIAPGSKFSIDKTPEEIADMLLASAGNYGARHKPSARKFSKRR